MRSYRALGHALLLLCVCLSGVCWPQSSSVSSAQLTGMVVDPGGATLPRARVLLLNLKSLQSETATVPIDGKFAFRNLQPGDYVVVVVGSSDPYEPCWIPVIKQMTIKKNVPAELRAQLFLDQKCGKGVDN